MEPIELEAAAFLILLEDVAAQAPVWSDNRGWLNAERAPEMPELRRLDSLTLLPNGEIRAQYGAAELLEAMSPKNECAPLRPFAEPLSVAGRLAAGSTNEAAPGPVRESPLHPAGQANQLDESWALTTDAHRSRAGLESEEQIVNPFVQPREATSEIDFQEAESSWQEVRSPSSSATGNTEHHVPDTTSLGFVRIASNREAPLAVDERPKLAAPADSIHPTHQVSLTASEAGSSDLLESIRRGSGDTSGAASTASEQSTYVGARSMRRRAAGQQSQNQRLAARIASLEEQLKPDIKEARNHVSYPRLCYPA